MNNAIVDSTINNRRHRMANPFVRRKLGAIKQFEIYGTATDYKRAGLAYQPAPPPHPAPPAC